MPVTRRTPPPLDTPDDVRQLNRQYVIGLVCMLALIVAFPLYNAGEPARRARAESEMQRDNVALGRTLFSQHCASCHGEDARGGRGSPTLASREFLESVSDRQLHWLISGGVPGSVMSAYDLDLGGPFTAQEITRVVAYLRSFEKVAPSVPGWFKGALAPQADESARGDRGRRREERHESAATKPIDAEGSAEQVAEVFATRCSACHGARGEGTPIAPSVRPLRPALAVDVERVVSIVTRGVPGTSMAAYASAHGGTLDAATIRGLVAWMQESAGGAPRRNGKR